MADKPVYVDHVSFVALTLDSSSRFVGNPPSACFHEKAFAANPIDRGMYHCGKTAGTHPIVGRDRGGGGQHGISKRRANCSTDSTLGS